MVSRGYRWWFKKYNDRLQECLLNIILLKTRFIHIIRFSTKVKLPPEVTEVSTETSLDSLDYSGGATVAASIINLSKKVRTAIDLNFNLLI